LVLARLLERRRLAIELEPRRHEEHDEEQIKNFCFVPFVTLWFSSRKTR
jgi:hypothetical protein